MMVNNPRGAACAKPKIVLLLAAALAALAVAWASSIPSAGAASGSGAVSTDGPSAQTSKYESLWSKVSRHDKRWARSTAECESGGDPDAIGGGGLYRGAFQFMKSTWRHAPKSPGGDPIDYSYKTQAVVAVALMRKDGAGHWPNCG
jgi:Transglycosylase-like domain